MDRALLFALMRQESRFDPTARSGAGARGLMQLMPATATYVADKLTTDMGRKPDLYEPETNVTLGQHYVRYLLDQKGIENDLILTIAAYNAGPGNLESWRKKLSRIKDPVLFIESMPVRETRQLRGAGADQLLDLPATPGPAGSVAGGHCGRPLAGLYGDGRRRSRSGARPRVSSAGSLLWQRLTSPAPSSPSTSRS